MLMWGMLKMMNSMQFDMRDSKPIQKIKTDLLSPSFLCFRALSSAVALRSYLAPVLKKKKAKGERAHVSIRQHTPVYVSICQQMSAYVSICQRIVRSSCSTFVAKPAILLWRREENTAVHHLGVSICTFEPVKQGLL
jgi:hypothetical protein